MINNFTNMEDYDTDLTKIHEELMRFNINGTNEIMPKLLKFFGYSNENPEIPNSITFINTIKNLQQNVNEYIHLRWIFLTFFNALHKEDIIQSWRPLAPLFNFRDFLLEPQNDYSSTSIVMQNIDRYYNTEQPITIYCVKIGLLIIFYEIVEIIKIKINENKRNDVISLINTFNSTEGVDSSFVKVHINTHIDTSYLINTNFVISDWNNLLDFINYNEIIAQLSTENYDNYAIIKLYYMYIDVYNKLNEL